jgi:hypothetical protein
VEGAVWITPFEAIDAELIGVLYVLAGPRIFDVASSKGR